MEKKELEDIYNEFLDYAEHSEQHEFIAMLKIEMTLKSQLEHFDEMKDNPEWLCKILNGEKTIEVRRKVLNCLKEII